MSQGSAARGFLWIGLILTALIVAIVRLTTTAAPTVQVPVPPPPPAQTASQSAGPAAADKFSQANAAALGLTEIRHAIANANTLQLSRVTTMPTGALCYQLHLKNSHGVAYVRTAVIDGTVLSTSGSDGFAALWNRLCAQPSGGRDITVEVRFRVE